MHSKAMNELKDDGANAIANSSLGELELGSESLFLSLPLSLSLWLCLYCSFVRSLSPMKVVRMYAIDATHPKKCVCTTRRTPPGVVCAYGGRKGGVGCLHGGSKMCQGENFVPQKKNQKKVLGQLAEDRRCIIKCLRRWWVFRHGIILPG